jgi:hypothetical protein
VDLLYIKLYSISTTNPQQIHNNPQQIHSKSTTFRLFDKSTTSRHVKMLWICLDSTNAQQIESMAYGFLYLSTTSRKAVQQIHSKSTTYPQLYDKSYNLLYNKSIANPQQIEQGEFQLFDTLGVNLC